MGVITVKEFKDWLVKTELVLPVNLSSIYQHYSLAKASQGWESLSPVVEASLQWPQDFHGI